MNKRNLWLVLGTGVAGLAFSLALGGTSSVRAGQGPMEVQVVNDGTTPVPVSGAVIAEQPTGQAYVVSVANPSLMVSAAQASGSVYRVVVVAPAPLRLRLCYPASNINADPCPSSWENDTSQTVAIEAINGWTDDAHVFINAGIVGATRFHSFTGVPSGTQAGFYSHNHATLIYLPPGFSVSVLSPGTYNLAGHFQ